MMVRGKKLYLRVSVLHWYMACSRGCLNVWGDMTRGYGMYESGLLVYNLLFDILYLEH